MPKAPRLTEGDAPKKRTRKSAVTTKDTAEDTINVLAPVNAAAPKKSRAKTPVPAPKEILAERSPESGSAHAVAAVDRSSAKEVVPMASLEERIRIRAYELYLRRGGRGGSPEQDWFQAVAEIYGESVA